ncbi:MAG TPA: STAS domain-containing protein [Terriglobia bacterium]|jgi:anti-anti-sigma factor|nr:STAS domain-containing protein [Terriglobia bacterium]
MNLDQGQLRRVLASGRISGVKSLRSLSGLSLEQLSNVRSALRIAVRFRDDISVVSLTGKFVAGSDGPFLRQKVRDLIDAGTRKFLFDFTDVPYIDSTGLGFLAGSRELAVEHQALIVLVGINPHVQRILDGVKLSQFFELVPDEDAGVARIGQMAPAVAASPAAEAAKAPRGRKRPAATPE